MDEVLLFPEPECTPHHPLSQPWSAWDPAQVMSSPRTAFLPRLRRGQIKLCSASPDDHAVGFPGQAVHFFHRDLVNLAIDLGWKGRGAGEGRSNTVQDQTPCCLREGEGVAAEGA